MTNRPHRVLRYIRVDLMLLPGNQCRVTVELSRDSGETYLGTAEGVSSPPETREVAARAALEAIRKAALVDVDELTLEGVSIGEASGKRTITVVLTAQSREGKQRLLGACFVDSDATRATALAVLNATNRFLGLG